MSQAERSSGSTESLEQVSFIEHPRTWIGRRAGEEAAGIRAGGRRRWTGVALVALLVPIAIFLITRRGALADIRRLSIAVLAETLALQVAAQLLWNAAMLLPLRTSLETLGYWELFIVRSGGLFAGYVVPVAGNIGVRLAYLRQRGLTYRDFAWATFLSNALALFAAAALAAWAVVMIWLMTGETSASVLGLTAGIVSLGVGCLLAVWGLPRVARHPRLPRWRWLSSVAHLRATPRTVVAVSFFSLGRHLVTFLTFGLLYHSLSPAPAGVLTGGLVYAITSPVRIVAITPGNLGIHEWVVAVVGKLLSFDLATGLVVALVFRGLTIAAQLLGTLVAGTWLAIRPSE
jgi:hypothetical protein